MMPKLDGIHATLRIREESSIPIIILSAKTEDADKILGLNIGADDYVTSWAAGGESEVSVRRYTGSLEPWQQNGECVPHGGLVVDDDKKQVTVDGENIRLTPMEFPQYSLLPGRQLREGVYSIEQIYESIWNEKSNRST